MAAQALLVVLTPIIVEVGRELGVSVEAVGQARSWGGYAALELVLGAATVLSAVVVLRVNDPLAQKVQQVNNPSGPLESRDLPQQADHRIESTKTTNTAEPVTRHEEGAYCDESC